MNIPDRPITILIAALGGEGGGVMAEWLIDAAAQCGFPSQSTSIPGVAQRTGATTYYLEIFPAREDQLGGRVPVLSLTPSPGNVDIMVASELIEAGRAMQNGYVSPERTTLVASTHRIYATIEKMQMGDGRFDSDRVIEAGRQLAKQAVLFDMRKLAQDSGTVINAVLFGAMAGSGVPAAAARGLRAGDPSRRARRRGEPARLRRRLRHRRRQLPGLRNRPRRQTRGSTEGGIGAGRFPPQGLPGRRLGVALVVLEAGSAQVQNLLQSLGALERRGRLRRRACPPQCRSRRRSRAGSPRRRGRRGGSPARRPRAAAGSDAAAGHGAEQHRVDHRAALLRQLRMSNSTARFASCLPASMTRRCRSGRRPSAFSRWWRRCGAVEATSVVRSGLT